MKQIKRSTSINAIAEYWINNSNICETELNFDWCDAYTHCWNCGDDKYSKSTKRVYLERCHIIARALGGLDTAGNYVLMCKECHTQAPNTSNPNDMWDWIKSNYIPFSFSNTYRLRKALVLFKQNEGYSFFDKIVCMKNFANALQSEMSKISTHGCKINESTYYFMLKSIVKKQVKS